MLSRAWQRALRHAAVPFKPLALIAGETQVAERISLAAALDLLPEEGLVAVLEDREGHRGLLALSHGAVDAMIEVQTTGKVDAQELAPRPVTRVEKALCRDFIDLSLGAFAREASDIDDRDWPQRMAFGSRIADRKQLTLLLPDKTYHAMSTSIELGEGVLRTGTALLILPKLDTVLHVAPPGKTRGQPEEWRVGLEAAMAEAHLDLIAVLLRTTRSLRDLEALGPGDLISFEADDLASVRLETTAGDAVFRGRLGQVAGRRALRMSLEPKGPDPTTVFGTATPAAETPEALSLAHDGAAEPDLPAGLPDLDLPNAAPMDLDAALPDGLPDGMPQPMAAPLPAGLDDLPGDLDAPAPAPLDFMPQSAPLDPDALPE